MPERDKGRSRFQNRFFLLSYHRKLKLFFSLYGGERGRRPSFLSVGWAITDFINFTTIIFRINIERDS